MHIYHTSYFTRLPFARCDLLLVVSRGKDFIWCTLRIWSRCTRLPAVGGPTFSFLSAFLLPFSHSPFHSLSPWFCSTRIRRRVQIEYSHVAIIVRGILNRFIDFTAVYFARVFCMFDWIASSVLNKVEIKCLKFIRRNNTFSSSIKSSFPLNFFNFFY